MKELLTAPLMSGPFSIIYVIDGSQGRLNDRDKNFIAQANDNMIPTFFVCNKIEDPYSEQIIDKIKSSLKQIYSEYKYFFALSSKDAFFGIVMKRPCPPVFDEV